MFGCLFGGFLDLQQGADHLFASALGQRFILFADLRNGLRDFGNLVNDGLAGLVTRFSQLADMLLLLADRVVGLRNLLCHSACIFLRLAGMGCDLAVKRETFL